MFKHVRIVSVETAEPLASLPATAMESLIAVASPANEPPVNGVGNRIKKPHVNLTEIVNPATQLCFQITSKYIQTNSHAPMKILGSNNIHDLLERSPADTLRTKICEDFTCAAVLCFTRLKSKSKEVITDHLVFVPTIRVLTIHNLRFQRV